MELAERLKILIQKLGHTPASFAEELNVQRSGISHLLSGRNKPGLEFIQKIISHFPGTDINWLITGEPSTAKTTVVEKRDEAILPPAEPVPAVTTTSKKIVKVVLFYDDHTFEEFQQAPQ